jgi:membrane protein involved in colicin uptake
MFVIRLPNGNLKVPRTATGHDGRIIGDVYVEIGPQDADYARLAAQALTAEEVAQRRDRWRQDDEALRQEFLEFAKQQTGDYPWPDSADGDER